MPDAFDQLNDTEQHPTAPAPVGTTVAQQPQAQSQRPQPSQQGDAFDQLPDDTPRASATNDPRKPGEITNDVGNTVIVPKEGESFADTVKRATTRWKALPPDQQQKELDRETRPKDVARKTAETLGAAAGIGVVGPALLAAPGEIAEAVPSVLTHTIQGVKAIGAWAAKNPVQAYLLFQVMKELLPGAKKAMGVIKGVPEVE
jgi:hypothetical protein